MKKVVAGILFLLPMVAFSQLIKAPTETLTVRSKGSIICFGSGKNVASYIPPPKEYLDKLKRPNARIQTANFNVVYVGFTSQAQTSFQAAVDIWASLLQSDVTINVLALWRPLTSNTPGFETLGQASWGTVNANFDGAPKINIFYPAALAEKLAGKNLNSTTLDQTTGEGFDIIASFNSDATWDFTVNPSSGIAGKTHLQTVVLHELGHGLGFTDSYDISSGSGSYGVQSTGTPIIFDLGVESGSARLLNTTNNTVDLGTLLTNQNITYNSPLATAANGNQKPKLYAPSTWQGGSSIAHLDQSTYSGSSPNKLMRPTIDNLQVTLDPGPIVKNMFFDMGWQAPRITHTSLTDTEATGAPFTINATVASDGSSGYSVNSVVKLRYSINGAGEVEVNMTAGSGNQYSAQLPAPTAIPSNYAYYIVTTDNLNRTFTKPGQLIRPGQTDQQASFQFKSGPDTTVPVISHTPADFIKEGTTSLDLKISVTDNIGVQGTSIDYKTNSGSLQNIVAVQDNDTLSLYKATIPTSGLLDGTTISYRIAATDNSSNLNKAFAPTSTTFYEVAVIGNVPAQNSYSNDFNSTTDFFGNGYSITTPSGFNNGAIHSQHPYPVAGNGPNLNFIYQLRIPIKVKAQDAIIRFDEIVLVEPGEPNSTFGTTDFYDYVVVEGSKNGGTTWTPIADGYDSRDNTDWLAKYNSSIVANISQGVGDPTLYRPRTLNLLNKFAAGDEVLIRFRLFSDEAAAGWGWAIDNLKIQIDETPPATTHNHFDYITSAANPLRISISASDPSGLKSLTVEYKVNNGAIQTSSFPVSNSTTQYNFDLDISSLSLNDLLEYRITSYDNLDNTLSLPATGFFKVPFIAFSAPVSLYTSDFNSANTDFVGNFFSIATPSGFSDGAIHSSHPYPNGFGTNNESAFSYTLKKPITVSNTNHIMVFNEIVIAESTLSTEYVITEGSKDNGTTWESLVSKYSSSSFPDWVAAFNSKQNGIPSQYKLRVIDLTQTGKFKAGDNILIRFRLNANATNNAWGWAIDNLSIQGPITAVERNLLADALSIYPNPSTSGSVHVEFATEETTSIRFQMLNSFGQVILVNEVHPVDKIAQQEYNITDWANGIYIIKAEVNGTIITKKFIKAQ